MLVRPGTLVGVVALAAALTACAHTPQTALDPAKARAAYAVGQRLAAEDREERDAHRAEMAQRIDATVSQTRDVDRTISLFVRLHNKSAKAIKSLDAGLEIHDASGARVGMSEIHLVHAIPAHMTSAFWYPMRYLRFGEDAGTMRMAAGKPKTVDMDVTEIKYADGSDAGYDD